MCGRYELEDYMELNQRFGVQTVLSGLAPRYNVAPTQMMPVITAESPDELQMMRWGLVPFWSKDGKGLINARAETLDSKAAFKRSLQFRRCLVPAGGFYEWQRTATTKQPFFIHLRDAKLFAFAGLYSTWRSLSGEVIPTYTIITTEPNELMAPIHNRMPVILQRDDEAAWLDLDRTEPERLLPLLRSYPAAAMDAYPISELVNRPGNDSREILERLAG
jgi:putative SOS response-associated peptidase YedK